LGLSLQTKYQKLGFVIYLVGILLYFSSWAAQIYLPNSTWSSSIFGFMAPAYTTIIWFIGIGLVGRESFLKIPHTTSIYIFLSIIFVLFHSYHSYSVYNQL
jgi:hypothetical protein